MMHPNTRNNTAHLKRCALVFAGLALALAAAPARAGAQNREMFRRLIQSGDNDPAMRALDTARNLIDSQKWEQAASAFDRFIVQYPSDKNLDAALFWLSYAHSKQGNYQAAYDTVTRLLQSYPRSSWAGDARELRVEVLSKLRPGERVD